MKAIFVTGTDTAVGKTIVCGLLGRYLKDRGIHVITQKWIQTGTKKFANDIYTHLKLMDISRKDIEQYLPYISPYTFRGAYSPHLASALEKEKINAAKIKSSFKLLTREFDFVIVEGAGGALVPFNKRGLMIDIAKDLGLPVLIVSGNKLGAINHTLLTAEAIRRRNMRLIGVVFNNQGAKKDQVILRDNPKIIKKLSREKILGTLPWRKDKKSLYRSFIPIGRWITGLRGI